VPEIPKPGGTVHGLNVVVDSRISVGSPVMASVCPECGGRRYVMAYLAAGGTAPHTCPRCRGAGVLAVRFGSGLL
jgi:DnaJ-class molecular chaperone